MTARQVRRRAGELGGAGPAPCFSVNAVGRRAHELMGSSARRWLARDHGRGPARRLAGLLLAGGGRDWLAPPGRDEIEHAELLEGAARSLRAGSSLASALAEAQQAQPGGRSAADLERALGLLEVGMGVTDVIDAWVAARPGPARVLAGAALGLGSELGGAQARSLDGAGAGLRDRADLMREVRALTSQARTSAAVMVLAPVGFAAYSWVTDGRVGQVMLTTPVGWVCLVAGVVLDGLGALWMVKLVGQVT